MKRQRGYIGGGVSIHAHSSSTSGGFPLFQARRTIHNNLLNVVNISNVIEPLMTFIIPANTLSEIGKGFLLRAWGVALNNADVKLLETRFAGLQISGQVSLTASVAQVWLIEMLAIRSASDALKHYTSFNYRTNANAVLTTGLVGLDFTVDNITGIYCQTAAAGNIEQQAMSIELIN